MDIEYFNEDEQDEESREEEEDEEEEIKVPMGVQNNSYGPPTRTMILKEWNQPCKVYRKTFYTKMTGD